MALFPSSPEEFMEMMQKKIDSQQMRAQADDMAIQSLFDDITGEQLASLQKLLGVLANNPEMIIYFMGVSSSILKYKHNRCPHCGDPEHDMFGHLESEDRDEPESPQS